MLADVKDGLSTRERILAAALALFNEHGLAHVTIAEIAAAADMRQGNLHYHFPKKDQLVEALFELFVADELAVAQAPLAEPGNPASYAAYQRGWFELMWNFRCFYRDASSLLTVSPALRSRFAKVQRDAQSGVRAVLDQAVRHGLMTASNTQIDRLIVNVWIVSSHWMDYLRSMGTSETLKRSHLEWGFNQILSLYEPYTNVALR